MTSVSEEQRPAKIAGLRHLALNVSHFEACCQFYTELIGFVIEWQPDDDNLYLTSGCDNLALHRAGNDKVFSAGQRLDHIGLILQSAESVDDWCAYLKSHQVEIVKQAKTHRDGARSFYCKDPDGNIVQMIYHPPISDLMTT